MVARVNVQRQCAYLAGAERQAVVSLHQAFLAEMEAAHSQALSHYLSALSLLLGWRVSAAAVCTWFAALHARLYLSASCFLPGTAVMLARLQALWVPSHPVESLRRHYVAAYSDRETVLVSIALYAALHPTDSTPLVQQQEWSRDVLDVLVPAMELLGTWQLRTEMGDTAYAIAVPKEADACRAAIEEYAARHLPVFRMVRKQIKNALIERQLAAKVEFHAMHPTSLFRRRALYQARQRSYHFNDALQVLRVDVEAADERDCYTLLGVIHGLWQPVADGRFHDYIADPRINGYRSLITLVRYDKALLMQFIIFSKTQRAINLHGIMAAQTAGRADLIPRAWREPATAAGEEITVFSPIGERYRLPLGSTAGDYARRVHTTLGNQAHAFWVNGVQVDRHHVLAHHDLVRVEVDHTLAEWWMRSPSRRNMFIERFSRLQQHEKAQRGRELFFHALHHEEHLALLTVADDDVQRALQRLFVKDRYPDLDAFFCALAEGHHDVRSVAAHVMAEQLIPDIALQDGTSWPGSMHIAQCWLTKQKLFLQQAHQGRVTHHVPIVGFASRRSTKPQLVIHRMDCPLQPTDRVPIPLRWRDPPGEVEMVQVLVEAHDRSYLVENILAGVYRLYAEGVYLHHLKADVLDGNMARIIVQVGVESHENQAKLERYYRDLRNDAAINKYEIWGYQPGFLAEQRAKRRYAAARGNERDGFINPYSLMAMRERDMFFGRNTEVELALNYVQSPHHRLIVVTGPKRIGKTTFLYHLQEQLTDPALRSIPVYFDAQAIEPTEMAFCREFIRLCEERVQEESNGTFKPHPIPPPALAENPSGLLAQRLQRIAAWMEQYQRKQQIVVLVDEFTWFMTTSGVSSFFRRLRSLMQTQTVMRIVLCIHEHVWHDLSDNRGHELLQEAPHIALGRLKDEAARALIARPMAHVLTYTPEAVQALIELTAGHPYYTHILCFSAVNDYRKSEQEVVTKHDVLRIADRIIQQPGPYFAHYLAELSEQEVVLSKAFAYLAETTKEAALHADLRRLLRQNGVMCDEQRLREGLRRLYQMSVIEECSDHDHASIAGYHMPVGLLRRWLAKKWHAKPASNDQWRETDDIG